MRTAISQAESGILQIAPAVTGRGTVSNDLLRARREALPSPSRPGVSMSRSELAEAVNAHVWETTGNRRALDGDMIGRYERGLNRWPNAEYREGLRAVLGATSDSDLGFFPTRRGNTATPRPQVGSDAHTVIDVEEPNDPVDRRDFLRALTVAGLGASLDGLTTELQRLAPPRVISEVDIAHLQSVAGFFSSWSHTHGGQAMGQTVWAEMSRATDLLKVTCPPRLRPDLLSAVGHLGVVGGSLLFDAHQHPLSERILAFATLCAEEAGDWHLRAKALSWRARQAVWVGEPDTGLTFAQLGLVRDDRITPTERAMLHTAVARAVGRLGDVSATLHAIGDADDAFADADPASDVPWMAYYDHAQHVGDTGHALFELAIHGVRTDEAARRLSDAVSGHTDTYIRSRSFSGFKLAALTMHTGDPQQAVQITQAAVRDADDIHSQRLRRTALEIEPFAAKHRTDSDVEATLRSLRTVSPAA